MSDATVLLLIDPAPPPEAVGRLVGELLDLANANRGSFTFELVLRWPQRVRHIDARWPVAPTPDLLAALSEFGEVILPPAAI